MRFPEYAPEMELESLELPRIYTRLLGEVEPDYSQEINRLPEGNLRRASMMIGRACKLAQIDFSMAIQELATVRDELIGNHPNMDAAQRRKAAQLKGLVKILALEDRDGVEKLHNIRKKNYGSTLAALGETTKEISQLNLKMNFRQHEHQVRHTDLEGEKAEYRIELLLSRTRHPGLLVTPALVHHNSSDIPSTNYDFALIKTTPCADPTFQKIQVKSNCFGECPRASSTKVTQNRRRTFQAIRDRYAPDIALISACCDVRQEDLSTRDIDTLLHKEHARSLNPDMVHTLNTITDNVEYIAMNGVLFGRSGRYGTDL